MNKQFLLRSCVFVGALLCNFVNVAAWTLAASYSYRNGPVAAESFSFTGTDLGVALRFGGQSYMLSGEVVSRNDLYAFDGNTWTLVHPGSMSELAPSGSTAARMPTSQYANASSVLAPAPRNRHCAIWYQRTLIVVFGRYRDTNLQNTFNYDDIWVFDLLRGSWSQMAVSLSSPNPRGRDSMVCALRGDSIVMHGGVRSRSTEVLGDFWAFHIPTRTWSEISVQTGRSPLPVFAHAGIYQPSKDTLIVHGGRFSSGTSASALSDLTHVFTFSTPVGAQPVCVNETCVMPSVEGAWEEQRVRGQVVACSSTAYDSWGERLCMFGGARKDQPSGQKLTNQLLCLFEPNPARVLTGVQPLPVPQPSPSAKPLPAWMVWAPVDVASVPSPRYRSALAIFASGHAFVGADGNTVNVGINEPIFAIAGGLDYEWSWSDTWIMPEPSVTKFVEITADSSNSNVLFLSYLAYGISMVLMFVACTVCVIRKKIRLARDLRAAAAAPAGQQSRAARARTTGVDPSIVAALPTIKYAKADSVTQAPACTEATIVIDELAASAALSDKTPGKVENTGDNEANCAPSGAAQTAEFSGESITSCAICLQEFEEGECVKLLPCLHRYHNMCVDQWLTDHTACPLCKADVMSAAV